MMHCATCFTTETLCELEPDWDGYLWGAHLETPQSESPYPVALGAHGAFAVRRTAFEEVGGYWLWLEGFGGEEVELNLKMLLLGKSIWLTPRATHFHYLARDARRVQDELYVQPDLVRNVFGVCYVYGGMEQLQRAYNSFRLDRWDMRPLFPELLTAIPRDPEVRAQSALIWSRSKYRNLAELRAALDAQTLNLRKAA